MFLISTWTIFFIFFFPLEPRRDGHNCERIGPGMKLEKLKGFKQCLMSDNFITKLNWQPALYKQRMSDIALRPLAWPDILVTRASPMFGTNVHWPFKENRSKIRRNSEKKQLAFSFSYQLVYKCSSLLAISGTSLPCGELWPVMNVKMPLRRLFRKSQQ